MGCGMARLRPMFALKFQTKTPHWCVQCPRMVEIGEDMREAHFSCQLCLALEFKFCEVGNDMLEAHFCHALFQHCAQVS